MPVRPPVFVSRAAAVAVALAVAVAVAGCGSSQHRAKSAGTNPQLAFAQCMRAHGLTAFPDPGSAGGINIAGTGLNPASPAFKAARSACAKLLPGGGPGGHGTPTAQDKRQMLAISTCMRAHGVTDFPDPTTTAPSSLNGYGEAMGHDGLFLLVPSTIDVNSPTYEHAASACGFH